MHRTLLFKMEKNKTNKPQNSFIEDIKDRLKNNSKKILYFPKTSRGGTDNVNDYYIKPVIFVSPDSFPGFNGTCPHCNDEVKSKGWQTNHRYVHGLRHGKLFDFFSLIINKLFLYVLL